MLCIIIIVKKNNYIYLYKFYYIIIIIIFPLNDIYKCNTIIIKFKVIGIIYVYIN